MPSNQAAWVTSKTAKSLEINKASYTSPAANEIVIRNGAIAVNPVDWMKIVIGDMMFSWFKYPGILGSDVAGEVVEVGKGVNRFRVGDRVVGHAVGLDKRSNGSTESAFQEYVILRTNMSSQIPSSMPFENACVLPLGLSTAACGLFMKDFLALQYPTKSPKPIGQTLIVWGGSTSVGSNAIQLAVAAGYNVFTTSSPKNFGYVKKLGAIKAFDYRSPTVVQDMIQAMKGQQCAGAIAIGDNSIKPCIDIVAASKGRKFIATATAPAPFPDPWPSSILAMIPVAFSFVMAGISSTIKGKMKGVGSKFIFGSDNMANEVGKVIYEDFLPAALAEGRYIAAPDPVVVGKGLGYLQEAFDTQKKGLSAKKAVVSM